ncbi:MAG: acyl--CoA ligase [Sphingopyxis sp.]|nr:acyl--CoA ligase [Sphingopyxis sp.]
MPTPLDQLIESSLDAVIGEGKMFTLGSAEVRGVTMPIISNAPPSLPFYFAHFCAQHGDAIFLVDGEERLSFADTYARARDVAVALVEGFGVEKGDRVGIAMRNAPSWVVTYMGVLMAGGVATLLNGWWQGPELAAGIRDAGCKLVLADEPRVKRLSDISESHGAEVVGLDVALPIAEAIRPITSRSGSASAELPMVLGDDLATILFTSGSTGQSKGAFSTHRSVVQGTFNYIAQTAMIVRLLTTVGNPPTGQASTLLNVPLFHVTGEVPVFLQSFAIGRKLVMMPKWDAEEAMRLIEKEQITYFVGVPLMSYEMLIHPNRDKYDLSSCKSFAAGGAPRPRDHVERLAKGMGGGMPLLGYGLTETNGVGCGNVNDNYIAKPDSTGPASRPLVDLAIIDDAGNVLPQGEVGEVSIRSVCNFDGYWNNPEATAAAYTADARFRTGDLGYLDEDGYLFIVDRKKDIIIRGGENISCPEVEAAIYGHTAVAECSVFGLPDDRFGEIVGAVVHYKPGEAIDEDEMRTFLGSRLAAFKVPAVIWESKDALPVLGTGKLDRVGLRTAYRARYAAEVGAPA